MGLFAGLFFARAGEWPRFVPEDVVSMRNKVIHDDRLPTEEEAFCVAEAVQTTITVNKTTLGLSLFESHVMGPKAQEKLDRALRAAGIEDEGNVLAFFEPGSLTHADVREIVRHLRSGEPLLDPPEH
jgi:hypothetical protein